MKIRSGFVSNSSSSSFIVITTVENWADVRSKLVGEMEEFVSQEIAPNAIPFKINGIDMVDLSRVVHDGGIGKWDDDSQDGNGGYRTSVGELFYKLTETLSKSGAYVTSDGC